MAKVGASISALFHEWINKSDSEIFTFTPQMVHEKYNESLIRCKSILKTQPQFIKKYKLVEGTVDTFTPRIHISKEDYKKKYEAWKKKYEKR